VNLKTRILGVSAGVALAVGMAGPAFAGAPVVETGATAFDRGSMSSRGSCSTMLIGTVVNSSKTLGMSSAEHDLTISAKGYPRSAADAAGQRVGECAVRTSVGFSGGTPSGLGDTVFKYIAKIGTKLTSGAADCNRTEGADSDERPLAGKMSVAFTDGSKLDAYVRVQGFDTVVKDKLWMTGIVAKGEAVGATVGGNVWFSAAYKAKTATGYYGSPVDDDPKTSFDESGLLDPAKALAPGYATEFGFMAVNALGCNNDLDSDGVVDAGAEATQAAQIGRAVGDEWFAGGFSGATDLPGIDLIGLGAGTADGTVLASALGSTADGINFLL